MFTVKLIILLTLITSFTANQPRRRFYIYSGDRAVLGQFPFQIAILDPNNILVCGGAIIHKKWALSAAHCFTTHKKYYKIKVGMVNLYDHYAKHYYLRKIIKHKDYYNFLDENDEDVAINDIALLKIKGKGFNFKSSFIAPIELEENKIPVGSQLTISGWGYDESNKHSPYLKYTDNIYRGKEEECKKIFGDYYFDGILCLVHPNKTGPCYGDSGGPVIYKKKLAGIISFGLDDCASHLPDAYVKISYYINWILENI